jgi:hypothetical protein
MSPTARPGCKIREDQRMDDVFGNDVQICGLENNALTGG